MQRCSDSFLILCLNKPFCPVWRSLPPCWLIINLVLSFFISLQKAWIRWPLKIPSSPNYSIALSPSKVLWWQLNQHKGKILPQTHRYLKTSVLLNCVHIPRMAIKLKLHYQPTFKLIAIKYSFYGVDLIGIWWGMDIHSLMDTILVIQAVI